MSDVLEGWAAVNYYAEHGGTLLRHAYYEAPEGEVSLDEAVAICQEIPSLVWIFGREG